MLSSEGGMRFCQKMVLVGYGSGRALFNRFAAVGRMALSNYLTHSLIMTSLCYGYGPGLDSGDPRYLQQGLVVALIGLLLLVSPWWLYYFRFGPAERLCRSPTYGQRQPMRTVFEQSRTRERGRNGTRRSQKRTEYLRRLGHQRRQAERIVQGSTPDDPREGGRCGHQYPGNRGRAYSGNHQAAHRGRC
ncbi:MAG: DUF418 domain-containing protein [Gammaproteobacteria bacterium]|nr:DUF418 domain-containing protein [Gammaproteobacteria bacterium]